MVRVSSEDDLSQGDRYGFVAYPDPEIAVVIDAHPDARKAFVSDFHLTCEEVARLLRQNGFADIAAVGFVSGDVTLSKKSGRLFACARDALAVDRADWFHIGDDEVADVMVPRRLGIGSQHYMPEGEDRCRRQKEALFGRPHVVIADACRSIAEEAEGEGREKSATMQPLGEAAALFGGFALWVLEEALIATSERVIFHGLEGEFLVRVYQEVARVFADALPVVPAMLSVGDVAPVLAANAHVTIVDLFGNSSFAERLVGLHPELAIRRLSLCSQRSRLRPGEAEYIAGATEIRRYVEQVASNVAIQDDVLRAVAKLALEFRAHAICSGDVRPFAEAVCRPQWRHSITRRLRTRSIAGYWVPAAVRLLRKVSKVRRRLNAKR